VVNVSSRCVLPFFSIFLKVHMMSDPYKFRLRLEYSDA
jgi:hypothetical protein